MYARSTSISGDAGKIDAGIAFVSDEVQPVITSIDGCQGLSLVVDREAGRLIATSSWRDRAAMTASDESLAPFRERGGEILGGTADVHEWEVAVMHRDHATHEGCCCRVSWARAEDIDTAVTRWRTDLLPQIEERPGFCSASLLIDRDQHLMCGTVTFDSREALEASREFAAGVRAAAKERLGLEVFDHAEVDLVLAHLRIPELV
ncbi:antibiotic biosynthesis monooxygenase [Nocardioides sp.]|uniref:antibiotic biosynthesis monooxygenase n=1 Tax=Nocardioides sp. TaxID=35761 RepID=UPI003562AFD1